MDIIQIFTDISLYQCTHKKKTAASFALASLIINDMEREWRYSKNIKFKDVPFDIIPVTHQMNTNILEAYAIWHALVDINEIYGVECLLEKDPFDTEIHVYTDSESVFSLFHRMIEDPLFISKKKTSRSKKWYGASSIMSRIFKIVELLKDKNIIVELRCIKGHTSIYGNTHVNKMAKNLMTKDVFIDKDLIAKTAYEIYLRTGNTDEKTNWFAAIEFLQP